MVQISNLSVPNTGKFIFWYFGANLSFGICCSFGNIFFWKFAAGPPPAARRLPPKKHRILIVPLGDTGLSLWKYRPRSRFCPEQTNRFVHGQITSSRNFRNSEHWRVDGIYLASPGLLWDQIEPTDHILMFCSANVPSITYKINFEDFVLHFWKKIFESSTKTKFAPSGRLDKPFGPLIFIFS